MKRNRDDDDDTVGACGATECPICYVTLVDPLSPCKVSMHKFCRECIERMRQIGISNACPQCRGELTHADELVYEAVCSRAQAEHADAQQAAVLGREVLKKLNQAVQVDPQHMFAPCILGNLFNQGWSVERDAAQAAKWFRKAAEQGNAAAQHNLGALLLEGDGVEKNVKEAASWFLKAAEQKEGTGLNYMGGQAAAQYKLSFMCLKGEGVEQDAAQSAVWCKKAAEKVKPGQKCCAVCAVCAVLASNLANLVLVVLSVL